MLRSIRELIGYSLRAADGDIGNVADLYFDDRTWTARYIVAETGGWLTGRQVLISPTVCTIDARSSSILVPLTREHVEASPGIDAAVTVARQQEEALSRYYGWPAYWMDGLAVPVPVPHGGAGGEAAALEPPSHLRSVKEVTNYHIGASDNEIGHVSDFIMADEEHWLIRYLVVDTGNWLPGKKVLLARDWVRSVSWAEQKVFVDASSTTIRNSPPFNPSEPVNREYEVRLYDYYGRPKYWS